MTDDETPAAPAETHHEPQFTPSAEFNVAEGRRDVGLCFVGSSMTAGYGDPKGLGWVGRVVGRTQHPDLDLTAYNLGVRGDTSADVMARWRSETRPALGEPDRASAGRLGGRQRHRHRASVSPGPGSTSPTSSTRRRPAASRCSSWASPRASRPSGTRGIEALAEAQADVCARRGVAYVDCFKPLVGHEQWLSDVNASPDRVHPGQAGYGLIAWLVLHNGWNDWMRISS